MPQHLNFFLSRDSKANYMNRIKLVKLLKVITSNATSFNAQKGLNRNYILKIISFKASNCSNYRADIVNPPNDV
jgi:hypothetical protein